MKKTKKIKLLKGEKFFITLIVLFGILAPIITVSSKAILSRSNIELERVKRKVENQEKNTCGRLCDRKCFPQTKKIVLLPPE